MNPRTLLPLVILLMLAPLQLSAAEWELKDPRGDDKGPGGYSYPTDAVYKQSSFDLLGLKIEVKSDEVVFEVKVGRKIEDPWNSKEWNGNGFSLQYVQVYLDMDSKEGSGHEASLPGMNVRFSKADAWDKVVLISPQSRGRLKSEVQSKASELGKDVVYPKSVKVRGKKIRAVVKLSDLGGAPKKGWGVQAIMQSNEGYPAPTDVLSRKVNEIGGPHRFGGGNDYDCDPHAIDILAGEAKGEDSEKAAQFKALSTFSCEGVPGKPGKKAVVPVIRLR
jgi:carbohydrate-binding DOMON domain-containing protein